SGDESDHQADGERVHLAFGHAEPLGKPRHTEPPRRCRTLLDCHAHALTPRGCAPDPSAFGSLAVARPPALATLMPSTLWGCAPDPSAFGSLAVARPPALATLMPGPPRAHE